MWKGFAGNHSIVDDGRGQYAHGRHSLDEYIVVKPIICEENG